MPDGDGVVAPEQRPAEATSDAQTESALIAAGKLKRRERASLHHHVGSLVAWWAFIIIAVVIAGAWLWNLVAPPHWNYFTPDQASSINNVLVAILG